MSQITLRLGRRDIDITEPVFRQLRLILAAYNQLSDADNAIRIKAANTIVNELTLGKAKLSQVSAEEFKTLLEKLPEICGLKAVQKETTVKSIETDWGYIYAHLSMCLSWTYDYIDNNMTLSRLDEYRRYFLKHPPTHQLVAAYLGYEYKDKQEGSAFLRNILAQAKAQGVLN